MVPGPRAGERIVAGGRGAGFQFSELPAIVRDALASVGSSYFGAASFPHGVASPPPADDLSPDDPERPTPTAAGPDHDLFPDDPTRPPAHARSRWRVVFLNGVADDWLILLFTTVALVAFDGLVLQRCPDTSPVHAMSIAIWVLLAALFGGVVGVRLGRDEAFDWFSGYLLEYLLSLDNLFVFHLVFRVYKTPPEQMHKAVFLGIIGAVVMRMVFFMTVATLMKLFGWMRYPFGVLLIYSGIQSACDSDDADMDVEDTILVRTLRRCLGSRLLGSYEGSDCFTRDAGGRLQITLLFVVVCLVEFMDLVFALDSVTAKLAQIPNVYIAFSSTVFAMFGLRAMFFAIRGLVETFRLLKYGLAVILVFIGVELMFAALLKVRSSTMCILIVSVFVVCIVGSRFGQGKDLEKGA